jgi:serine/threonine protein kinase
LRLERLSKTPSYSISGPAEICGNNRHGAGVNRMDSKEDTIQLSANSLQSLASCPERYQIKALIGQGGMGMVFRAFDSGLQRDVAIKVLLFEGARDPETLQRFLREAQSLAVLGQHPNIVHIFSSGLNNDGNPYHVMEFLDGESLGQELKAGPLNAERFYEMLSQVLSGLEYAHQHKIAHRDLKPSNIMHCKDIDGRSLFKIIDFGIARLDLNPEQVARTLTRTDTILGSPVYMSPEQCRGLRGDHLSDIYSLGCIMHECIEGNPPFAGENAFETMYKHIADSPPQLDSVCKSPRSKQLAELVGDCLKKKPEDRPQTISEITARLRDIFCHGGEDIDLFGRRKPARARNKLPVFSTLFVLFAMIFALAAYQQFRKSAVEQEPIQKMSDKDRLSVQIEKLKAKLARRKAILLKKADIPEEEHYLYDLFALGRQELKSTLKEDLLDAERVYSEALSICDRWGESAAVRRAACHVLRAKSKWKQGRCVESDEDFNKAIELVTRKGKTNAEAYVDIMLERPLLRINTGRYADAYNDYMVVVRSFENGTGRFAIMDLARFSQTLDKLGDDRCTMTKHLVEELLKRKPRTEEDAVQMVILANRLTLSMKKIAEKGYARRMLSFSESLQKSIHGHAELKQASKVLRAALEK